VFDQVGGELSAEDEAVRALQILAHAPDIERRVDDVGSLGEEISASVVSRRDPRSTEECEMSRSCQSATFSNPACALLAPRWRGR
jgi:hypothetical protein